MSKPPHRLGRDAMEQMAASVLSFLAADDERFDRFLALTGLAVADLRAAAARPGFAENLLGYLAGDEQLLIAYAASEGRDPAAVAALAIAASAPPPE